MRPKALTLILAGGKGSRLDVLTQERAKPVMPFAGTLRLIDFALSNCMHHRLSDVWVIEQHELHSLNEHLSNGRPWDLDRTHGGLQVLPPYDAPLLLDTLDELAARRKQDEKKNDDEQGEKNSEDSTTLEDFGDELLPHFVKRGRAFAYRFDGYWRDPGTLESYWQAHTDLLLDKPELALDDSTWTIHTFNARQLPARIHSTARIVNSLIAPGCTVRGRVEGSVLAANVIVEADAVVCYSVVLTDYVIGRGAGSGMAILDAGVQVGGEAHVEAGMRVDPDDEV